MKKIFIFTLTVLIFASCSTGTKITQKSTSQKQVVNREYQEVFLKTNDSIDRYPMYPGGKDGVIDHLIKNLRYPQNARNEGIEGIVVVKFTVGNDGTIQDVEVVESVDPELDAEAVRVIKIMKAWFPGYKDGKPVETEFYIPIRFKLN